MNFPDCLPNGPSPNIYQRVETQITHLPQRGTRTTKSSIISLCVKNFPLEISKCVPIPKNESHWFAFKKRDHQNHKKKNNIHHGHPLFPPVFCGASQTILVKEVPPNSSGANSRGTFGGQNGGTKTKEGWKTGTPERSTCFGENFCLSKQSIQICGRLFKIHSFIHSFLLATFSNNEDKFLEENPISFQVLGCLKHTNTLPAIFGGFSSQNQSLRRLGVESD